MPTPPYRFNARVSARAGKRFDRRMYRAVSSRKRRVERIVSLYGGTMREVRAADRWAHYVSDKWFNEVVPF